MNTSQNTFLYEALSGEVIPAPILVYFEERLQARIYNCVMEEFLRCSEERGLTQAAVARRLRRRPEQINRWFASPTNLEIKTVSNLLLAISASELDDLRVSRLAHKPPRNYAGPDWLSINKPMSAQTNVLDLDVQKVNLAAPPVGALAELASARQ